MFTMCYTRSSIMDISLFRKSELRDEGGNKMGKIMAVKQTSHLIPMCHPLMI